MVKASRLNAIFLKGNLAFSWGDEMVHTCYLGALYYVTWNNFEVTRFPIGQKPMGYCGCKLFLKKWLLLTIVIVLLKIDHIFNGFMDVINPIGFMRPPPHDLQTFLLFSQHPKWVMTPVKP